jgi:hypothetical protein
MYLRRNSHAEELSGVGEFIDATTRILTSEGVIFKCFDTTSDAIGWLSFPLLEDGLDLSEVLTSPDLHAELPQLLPISDKPSHHVFNESTPFTFEGEVASMLFFGGPSTIMYTEDPETAINIASKLRRSIFQDRFGYVRSFHSGKAWSSWFKRVSWDNTWIIADVMEHRIWLMCTTASD